MLICADWRRYVNANMCLTALPVYVSCSLKSIIPIYCRSCRTDSGYVRYDLIFAFRVHSPAILLYIINNIMLLKRSIIAKSTVCADFFNNMLHRPLYSLLRTKGVESKAHTRTGLQYDYLSATIALQYNRIANVDRSVFYLQCERSCRSYIFSRSLHMDISFDGILHFALLTLSSSSIFQTPYRLLSAKLISHFLNFHLISR